MRANNSSRRIIKIFNSDREFWLTLAIGTALYLAMSFYGSASNEMWGRDEPQTIFRATRTLYGLFHANFYMFVNSITYDHPPLRWMILCPFLLLGRVTEFWARVPHILIGSLHLCVLAVFFRNALGRRGVFWLVFTYVFSGIFALNRCLSAHGLFAFTATLTFIFLEKALASAGEEQNKNLSWAGVSLAMCTLTYLEAFVFLPYAGYVYYQCVRRTKTWHLKPLFLYGGIMFAYTIIWIVVPLIKTYPWVTGNLMHLMQYMNPGKSFSEWVFTRWANVKHALLNDCVFVSLFLIPVLLALLISGKLKKVPGVLERFLLFWSVHLVIWIVLLQTEHGHAMLCYPMLFVFLSYGLSVLMESRQKSWVMWGTFFVVLIQTITWGASFLYFDVSFDGRKSPVAFLGSIAGSDGGVGPARLIGLKTTSYILRKTTPPNEMIASDVGDISFFYSGKESPYLKMNALLSMLQTEFIKQIPPDQPYVSISPADITSYDYETIKKYAPYVYIRVLSHGTLVYEVRSAKKMARTWEVAPDTFIKDYDKEFSGLASSLGAWTSHVPISNRGWVTMVQPAFGQKKKREVN